MKAKDRTALVELSLSGKLESKLEKYLKGCRDSPPEEKKKGGSRFPNLAGFCRSLGCGLCAFETLNREDPDTADYLLAVMEDEALNAQVLSATVAGTYLKSRLDAFRQPTGEESVANCGEFKVIFEHDIAEDGQ